MSNEKDFTLPPKAEDKIDKKTLVLDLDETLLHSQYIKFSSTDSDIVLKIEFDNEPRDIHVLIRPGAKEFIRKMNKFYEIVIFTASVSKYAIPLINLIDEKGVCIHRLFREHCSLVNTSFIKDLTKLGRDLKDIIIIDNTPVAYSLNKENGIPIVSWFEDKRDRELYNLIPILEFLSSVPDVREFIPKLVINNEVSYLASIDIMRKYKNSSKKMNKYKPSNTSNIKPIENNLKDEKGDNNKKIGENKIVENLTQKENKLVENKNIENLTQKSNNLDENKNTENLNQKSNNLEENKNTKNLNQKSNNLDENKNTENLNQKSNNLEDNKIIEKKNEKAQNTNNPNIINSLSDKKTENKIEESFNEDIFNNINFSDLLGDDSNN